MGMPLELNTMIVTKGNEERISKNDFVLTKNEYRLYPMNIPIAVRKTKNSEDIGTAIIKKVTWENEKTVIMYELTSLHSVN
ncbi:DUF2584 domain-containing protein [Bacillus sp. 1P06AnD]|uniref:DUF2584 domain-containing protein n=1 Tax=Bacillus sp. 1P06AnD TaxID=3132208 RepID=UPI0039A0492A